MDLYPDLLRRGYRREIFIAVMCFMSYLLGLAMVTKVSQSLCTHFLLLILFRKGKGTHCIWINNRDNATDFPHACSAAALSQPNMASYHTRHSYPVGLNGTIWNVVFHLAVNRASLLCRHLLNSASIGRVPAFLCLAFSITTHSAFMAPSISVTFFLFQHTHTQQSDN